MATTRSCRSCVDHPQLKKRERGVALRTRTSRFQWSHGETPSLECSKVISDLLESNEQPKMDAANDTPRTISVSNLTIALAVLAIFLVAVQRFSPVQRDSREPPFVSTRIPVVGHLIHVARQGSDYLIKLANRYHYDMYTLPILNGRMYIATSPGWAQAIQKAHKTLFFNTLVAQAMKNLFVLDEPSMALVNDNLNGESGKRDGIMLAIHDMMQTTLAPGPELDDLNKSILNKLAPDVNGMAKGGTVRINFYDWLRHHFSIASVSALWGARNPFTLYPDVEQAFWEFEAYSMSLMMMPLPNVFARKGIRARDRLFETWEEYADKGAYDDTDVSALIKRRAQINLGEYKMSKKMYARGEASLLFGALLNTIPAAFWLSSWIFEDSKLLVEIRNEVDDCITARGSSNKRTINATKLRTSCPLFNSAFRETLRLSAGLNSNRYVAKDTTITNNATGESYLLKKDSMVQIAGNVIHFQSLWGSDADSFNPRRFMASGEKARSEVGYGKPLDPAAPFRDPDGKLHSSAYRSFGGGNNICPGRHFAQTEILALASLFVAGFEMECVGSPGKYKAPAFEDYKMMMSTIKPGTDVEVDLRQRKGYEDVEWEFEM